MPTPTAIITTPKPFWIEPAFLESRGTRLRRARPPSMIASIGSDVPTAYARVISTAPASTRAVRARLITEAMIGPTQGVQTSPRLSPTGTPPQKPRRGAAGRPAAARPPQPAIRDAASSKRCCSRGTSMISPKRTTNATATARSASAGMASACTIADSASVKAVKLAAKPASTPSGRARPPPTPPERTIGRTGRMQGERMVTIPETKAKASRTAMAPSATFARRARECPRRRRRSRPPGACRWSRSGRRCPDGRSRSGP